MRVRVPLRVRFWAVNLLIISPYYFCGVQIGCKFRQGAAFPVCFAYCGGLSLYALGQPPRPPKTKPDRQNSNTGVLSAFFRFGCVTLRPTQENATTGKKTAKYRLASRRHGTASRFIPFLYLRKPRKWVARLPPFYAVQFVLPAPFYMCAKCAATLTRPRLFSPII